MRSSGWAALLSVVLLFAAPGCQSQVGEDSLAQRAPGGAPQGRLSGFAASESALVAAPVAAEREIIRNGSQQVEVEDLDKAITAVQQAAAAQGGRVQNLYQTDQSANFSLRVPAENLDALMDQVAELGEEEVRSTNSQDVTEQMRDLEAELTNQLALRDRFRELAKRAQKVEEILKVERELARVQGRVDSLTGRLKRLGDQVAMSELQVSLTGPDVKTRSIPGPVQIIVRGVMWFVEKLWVIEY